jgi:hypothetical protein
MIPPRTYEVESWHGLGLTPSDTVVEWALDAITEGYDSRSLRVLAGLVRPFDGLEVQRLYSAAQVELGIPPLAAEEYVECYIASVLRQMLEKKLSREDAMGRLGRLFCEGQLARPLDPHGYGYELAYDFYLLGNAMDDLKSPGGFDYYWKGADAWNIDSIIDFEAKRWLEAHRKRSNTKAATS